MTAPERILAWKNERNDGEGAYHGPVEGDVEPTEFMTTEYTRTDIHQAALDRIAELEGELEDIAGMGHDMPMTLELTDEQWARRRAGIMQRIARAVLAKGDG